MSARIDKRRRVIPWLLMATLLVGILVSQLDRVEKVPLADSKRPATGEMSAAHRLLHQRFQQAVVLLQHKQYEAAMQGFHEVLKLAPDLPEAHANMGFALLGLGEYEAARSFFDTASNLKPSQTNAYYGMAVALEALGDLPQAVATMRAFAHIVDENDPYRRNAESAIWEWEAAIAAQRNE